MTESPLRLDFPGQQKDLEPFDTIYREVILSEAGGRLKWPLGIRKRTKIASAIRRRILIELGHPLHPAIVCFGLRVCCHFHHLWTEELESNREWRRHRAVIDRAWRVIQAMEDYHGVQQLKTLCY